jgi:hypothetical protein
MELFALAPGLPNQSLRLTPPRVDALRQTVRGPFERDDREFGNELSPSAWRSRHPPQR